jgi:hypothetical protein
VPLFQLHPTDAKNCSALFFLYGCMHTYTYNITYMGIKYRYIFRGAPPKQEWRLDPSFSLFDMRYHTPNHHHTYTQHPQTTYMCVCVCIHIHISPLLCACIYVSVSVCVCVCVCLCLSPLLCACIYVSVYVCVCVCACL